MLTTLQTDLFAHQPDLEYLYVVVFTEEERDGCLR